LEALTKKVLDPVALALSGSPEDFDQAMRTAEAQQLWLHRHETLVAELERQESSGWAEARDWMVDRATETGLEFFDHAVGLTGEAALTHHLLGLAVRPELEPERVAIEKRVDQWTFVFNWTNVAIYVIGLAPPGHFPEATVDRVLEQFHQSLLKVAAAGLALRRLHR